MAKHACPQRDATIARLYRRKMSLEQIGAEVGLSSGGVCKAVRRMGLPPRREAPSRPRRRKVPAPKPVAEPKPAPAVPDWTVERDARLVASHGRYAEIAALADSWRMPLRRVMARYLAVRP